MPRVIHSNFFHITTMSFFKFVITITLLIIIGCEANAQQTFEDWKKQQMEEYQSFKEERDKEFMKYLEAAWKEVGSEKGAKQYEKAKPVSLPVADPNSESETETKKPNKTDEPDIDVKVTIPETVPDIPEVPDKSDNDNTDQEKEDEEIDDKTSKRPVPDLSSLDPIDQNNGEGDGDGDGGNNTKNLQTAQTTFFRVPVGFRFDPNMDYQLHLNSSNKNNKKGISEYWKVMGSSHYEPILERVLTARNRLQLNDWGFTRLLYQMAGEIYGNSHNIRVLFTWFMLSKADYTAKVGYNDTTIFLLTPSKHRLYNTDYFRLDGDKYYVFEFDETERKPQNVYTYKGTYPEANRKLNYRIDKSPLLHNDSLPKTFSFSYRNQEHTFDVNLNSTLISYYKTYPQADLDIYFSADVTPEINDGLVGGLKPLVAGKSEYEAVNMILRFVQTAFEYQVDHEQFGREKYLFPEETLFYPASDCEDRSILFAYLVRQLTGLDVVGLRYPSHLATAVHFTQPPDGDHLKVDGHTYTVADPTYKFAEVGMTMPHLKDQKPTVLKLDG